MNKLTSFQRKLVYLAGIVLLLIPVIALGLPASPPERGSGETQPTGGGVLQRLRAEHDLGESSLGNVDPASQTMNLVLLGLRGVATSLLWLDAQEQQKTKNWAELEATVNSITLLQPHFLRVWTFQGWNLAFNVSVEWDLVADRYFWVKQGTKFLVKGVDRNTKYAELYWYTGDTFGKKIGRADEWKQFRRFFKGNDPDKENYPTGIDPEMNPNNLDNYQVAREWFIKANEQNEIGVVEHIMARILFRSYPTRALFDFATALQRDGVFDEITRVTWDESFGEWTGKYGLESYDSDAGEITLESSYRRQDVEAMARHDREQKDERKQKLYWVARYQDMTNYRYWRLRSDVEKETNTTEAHRELYLGEQDYLRGDFTTAKARLLSGMEKYEKMLDTYPDLAHDDTTIEDALVAQLNWRAILLLDGEQPPESYPLKKLWDTQQARLPQAQEEFSRRKRQFR